MVLKITVKTLDSQNYEFEAEDSWNVQQFKDHIQSTVNVSANEQRLIFCGRVLQDDKKLTEYDCNGKVIHLVRRPPPSLDNNTGGSNSASADSNNNSGTNTDGSNRDNNRPNLDENNVLFSAMTLGPDANLNQILRQMLYFQHALYARNATDDGQAANPHDPTSLTDIDRHLHNAARLLRITLTAINECVVRMAAVPIIGRRGTQAANSSNSATPSASASTSASSQTADQPSNNDQTNDNQDTRPSTAATAASVATTAPLIATVDDIHVGSTDDDDSQSRRVEQPNVPRQALTTDDLPQPVNTARLVPTTAFRPLRLNGTGGSGSGRADGSRQNRFSSRRRGQTELERYLSFLNYYYEMQTQYQNLFRRYRQIIDMCRLGGLIMSRSSVSSGGTTNNPQASNSSAASSGQNQTQPAPNPRTPVAVNLAEEARILGLYVPRIMHHLAHLQHELSNFTVDFERGTLLLCLPNNMQATRRRRPNTARRSNPPNYRPQNRSTNPPTNQTNNSQNTSAPAQAETSGMASDVHQPEHTIEGSLTITATAIETTPIITTTSTSSSANSRPQANATIVITSEPVVQGGAIRIPVTMPIPHGSISVDFSPVSFGGLPAQGGQQQQQQQQQQPPPQQQQSRTAQSTTSNSTQTANRPMGVISGRIPLPFDYFLPCFSPWATYNASRMPARDANVPPSERTVIGSSAPRQQAAQPTVQPPPPNNININISGAHMGAPAAAAAAAATAAAAAAASAANAASQQVNRNQPGTDTGLAEMVTSLIGSIFRPPQQPGQNSQQGSNAANANQDPLFNMIPELALNAATQILGGVLGQTPARNQNISTNNSASNNHQRANRQANATTTTSSGTVMMDIDIDDSSSSQSESRYQDARESNSPSLSGQARSQSAAPIRPSSNAQSNLSTQPGHSQSSSQVTTTTGSSSGTNPGQLRYDRQQLVEMMQSHPDWIPIIEADIGFMEQHQQVNNNSQPFFSDAYLSSIPRKRRRLLTANQDRVHILQPSSSQAISNLLRRAVTSSSVSDVALPDQVLGTISNDSDLQSAYEDHIRSAVEARLRTDYDYSPEKFTNSSKYFK